MNAISGSVFSPQSSSSFRSILPIFLTITAVALAIIGFLALFQVSAFYAVSSYWYCFEIAALLCIALTGISCYCKKSNPQTIDSSNPNHSCNNDLSNVVYVPPPQQIAPHIQVADESTPQIVLNVQSDSEAVFDETETPVQGKDKDKKYVNAVKFYLLASTQNPG